jgi:hypothetical protein
MPAEIIDFTTRHRTPGAVDKKRRSGGALSPIAKNERLRSARRDAWRKADALTNYWLALLRFTDAVSIAKMHGVKETRTHRDQPRGPLDDPWQLPRGS